MSVYKGPWRKTGPVFWRTICLTGWHEWVFRTLAVLGGAAQGALLGMFIGIVLTAFGIATTAEVPPAAGLAALLGAAITIKLTLFGGVLGGLAGALLAYKANCPNCGSCIKIAARQVGGQMIPLIPIIILPETSACATLIPPGCP